MPALFITAFVFGLAGSFHCAAMCGPLALSIPTFGKKKSGLLINRLIYNLGRILSYGLIGILFGIITTAISVFILEQYLAIIAGIILLVIAVTKKFNKRTGSKLTSSLTSAISKASVRIIKNRDLTAVFCLGLLNGFLPCGLVYFSGISSIAAGGVFHSIIYMIIFGAGTIPVMLLAGYLPNFAPSKFRFSFNRAASWLTLIIAILFIVRGMALNIPYLSPGIKTSLGKEKIECAACMNENHSCK